MTEAIAIIQCAVRLTPDGHALMPALRNGLMNLLQRHGRSLRLFRSHFGSAARRSIGSQWQGAYSIILVAERAWKFLERFRYMGNLSDVYIYEAILVQQRGIRLTPNGHENMPGMLNNLGVSYLHRFEYTRDLSENLEAISVKQRVVQLTPNDHEDQPLWLNGLGISLQRRFEHTGDLSDISEAITAQQRAVQLYWNETRAHGRVMLERVGNRATVSKPEAKQWLCRSRHRCFFIHVS